MVVRFVAGLLLAVPAGSAGLMVIWTLTSENSVPQQPQSTPLLNCPHRVNSISSRLELHPICLPTTACAHLDGSTSHCNSTTTTPGPYTTTVSFSTLDQIHPAHSRYHGIQIPPRCPITEFTTRQLPVYNVPVHGSKVRGNAGREAIE